MAADLKGCGHLCREILYSPLPSQLVGQGSCAGATVWQRLGKVFGIGISPCASAWYQLKLWPGELHLPPGLRKTPVLKMIQLEAEGPYFLAFALALCTFCA